MTLAFVWATLSSLWLAPLSGWGQAAVQWCLVVLVGVPLFTLILRWGGWYETDWDAELVQLLEEMDR